MDFGQSSIPFALWPGDLWSSVTNLGTKFLIDNANFQPDIVNSVGALSFLKRSVSPSTYGWSWLDSAQYKLRITASREITTLSSPKPRVRTAAMFGGNMTWTPAGASSSGSVTWDYRFVFSIWRDGIIIPDVWVRSDNSAITKPGFVYYAPNTGSPVNMDFSGYGYSGWYLETTDPLLQSFVLQPGDELIGWSGPGGPPTGQIVVNFNLMSNVNLIGTMWYRMIVGVPFSFEWALV